MGEGVHFAGSGFMTPLNSLFMRVEDQEDNPIETPQNMRERLKRSPYLMVNESPLDKS